jgi:hypothetical protein
MLLEIHIHSAILCISTRFLNYVIMRSHSSPTLGGWICGPRLPLLLHAQHLQGSADNQMEVLPGGAHLDNLKTLSFQNSLSTRGLLRMRSATTTCTRWMVMMSAPTRWQGLSFSHCGVLYYMCALITSSGSTCRVC